jgi:formate dehydrogenase beta subunit
MSQKMGIHEWSYDNDISNDLRYKVPHAPKEIALKNVKLEVELGFDPKAGFLEAQRCLNCDIETVFEDQSLHRMRRLRRHLPDGLHHLHAERRRRGLRTAPDRAGAPTYAGPLCLRTLKTGRVMVKDEDMCLHCGLCAERCPTGAWDMKKFYLEPAQAESCRSR